MSKTKFVALAAVAFAFAFAVSTAFAATWDFGSSTIKKGSSGTYAMNAQTALNACNNAGLTVDGHFGAHSVAALVAFQASKGLTADGKAGNATKAALNNCGSTSTTSTTTTTPGSTTTTTTPANNSGAPLSINQAQAQSGYYNTSVGVGQTDKQVANIRLVTGAGGAGNLTGVNLSFYNMKGSTDYQFTKYVQSVGVWLNGTKVGTITANQFSQYNSIFSAFVPVSGAILNANTTNNLVISVTALPTIDSVNFGAQWGIDLTSIRYSDSTGVFTYNPGAVFGSVLSSSSTTSTQNTYFTFQSAATAQSIKLTVTRDVGDSNDSVVVGSAGSNTQNVKVAMIDLNAQGDTINLRRLPVTLSVAGSASIPSNIVNTVRLYDASGNQLDSQPVVVTTVGGAQTITFQNLNVNIPVNSTSVFTVKADFNTVNGTTFPAGESAAVSVSSSNVGNIQAYDSGNNQLTNASTVTLTGSTQGNNVSMYVNGINVTSNGTPSVNVAQPGGTQSHSLVTYTIPFSVTAFGNVAYLPSVAAAATSASAANAIQFCVDATTACAAAGTGVIQYSGNDTFLANNAGGTYQLPIGQTKNFNLIITYAPSSAIATRAQLLNVNWGTPNVASPVTASDLTFSTYTSGISSQAFKTSVVSAQ